MFTYPRKNPEISIFLLRTHPIFGEFNSPAERFCSWITEWVFKKVPQAEPQNDNTLQGKQN